MTFDYQQMETQREMLEALGIDGTSSDEEQIFNGRKRYLILVPEWRDPVVTAWLRVFDSLCLHNRLNANAVDGRGQMPRTRVMTSRFSTSRRFVAGLPINAYRDSWLERQVNLRNIVHPGPPQEYDHDPALHAM